MDLGGMRMAMDVKVYFLPKLMEPQAVTKHSAAVVVDVLRASTTITQALAAGAKGVRPCLEVGEAKAWKGKLPEGSCMLGGERGGVKIDGFDLGNSPGDYTPEAVGGKTVVFTTTNGTRAMHHCLAARHVWIGSFVNLSKVAARLMTEPEVRIVCAGTAGEVTREDVLFAGAVACRLLDAQPERGAELNDQTLLAVAAWREVERRVSNAMPLSAVLTEELLHTQGGRNLRRLGLAGDLPFVASVDSLPLLPELSLHSGLITL